MPELTAKYTRFNLLSPLGSAEATASQTSAVQRWGKEEKKEEEEEGMWERKRGRYFTSTFRAAVTPTETDHSWRYKWRSWNYCSSENTVTLTTALSLAVSQQLINNWASTPHVPRRSVSISHSIIQQQRNKTDLLQVGMPRPEGQRTDGLSRWGSLCRKSALHLTMTLTFDVWPWKPLQQCPLTWWIFVLSLTEYGDIASRETVVTDDGLLDERTMAERNTRNMHTPRILL